MNIEQLLQTIDNGGLDEKFISMYGKSSIDREKNRLKMLCHVFDEKFDGTDDVMLFSAPGRTEVGGNHTDHQRGRVLAAAVNMDVMAIARANGTDIVNCYSEGFTIKPVDITVLEPNEQERFTSESLIRGVAARFHELGHAIGGCDIVLHSTVLKGSGISSSAAFEVCIGVILNHLFNQGEIDAIAIAQIGQAAENRFFGKPCGLMDQMASSVGGFVFIDFYNLGTPEVAKVPFDFATSGYTLCIVDTGGSHEDFSDEYGRFPSEMKEVAKLMHHEVLSEVDATDFFTMIPELRKQVSDRAVLRALHFFQETDRVLQEVDALENNEFQSFLDLVIESGRSSFMYLQNVFHPLFIKEQGLSLALALSESYLKGRGAWRVHGGGLAGTIQVFVKNEDLQGYKVMIENVFGRGNCHVLRIRSEGGIRIC